MTDKPPPVLVGIDGTASGREALVLGSALAVLTGSPLVLGAVFGFEGDAWPPRFHADQWLDEAASQMGDAIPWSTTTIMSTSTAHGLTTLAEQLHAGWIVVGCSRRGSLGRVVLGTTARGVIHAAPCAVAVVPHGWGIRPPEQALTFGVGVNGSAESHDALALAAHLAVNAHAPLRVLTVVPVPSPAHPMFAATGTSYEGWRRDERRDAERAARAAVASAAVGADTEIVVLEGDPTTKLAEASSDLDLLIVGSRRYGPLRRALLGGVSAPLVEHARSPVLVVPRGVHPEPLGAEAQAEVTHA